MAWRWKPDPPSPEYIPMWGGPPQYQHYNRGGGGSSEFLARELLRQLRRENNKDKDKKKDDKKDEKTSIKDILAIVGLLTWLGPIVYLIETKIAAMIFTLPH